MKTRYLVFFLVIWLSFCVAKAQATPYSVIFDPDGSHGSASAQQIWGYDAEGVAQDSVGGNTVDVATHQQLGADDILNAGDTFYESFILNLLNGLNEEYNSDPWGGYYNSILRDEDHALYVYVELSGYIANYDDGGTPTVASDPTTITDDTYTSYITTGTATMFLNIESNDSGYIDYDSGTDIKVAEFSLWNASPIIMTPSVFSGAAAQTALAFKMTWFDDTFFSTAPGFPSIDDLVNKGMLITLSQDTIWVYQGALEGDTTVDPDEILIGFDFAGADIRFEALPEPASILLVGIGLLGIATVSRKKIFK